MVVTNGLLNSGNVNTSNLRLAAAATNAKLDELLAKTDRSSQIVLFDEDITVVNDVTVRPEAVIPSPELLATYSKYLIQIFSYDNPGNVSLLRESAINSNLYYHTLPNYKLMSMFASSVLEIELLTARNIAIKLSGNGDFKIRITAIR